MSSIIHTVYQWDWTVPYRILAELGATASHISLQRLR